MPRQQILASLAEPGAVLLQAGQHDLVAFAEMGPAEPLGIARAGVLALLRGAVTITLLEVVIDNIITHLGEIHPYGLIIWGNNFLNFIILIKC